MIENEQQSSSSPVFPYNSKIIRWVVQGQIELGRIILNEHFITICYERDLWRTLYRNLILRHF